MKNILVLLMFFSASSIFGADSSSSSPQNGEDNTATTSEDESNGAPNEETNKAYLEYQPNDQKPQNNNQPVIDGTNIIESEPVSPSNFDSGAGLKE